MIKINEFSSIKSASDIKKRRKVSASGIFSEFLVAAETREATSPETLSDVAAPSAVANLLSLQEVSGEINERRKMVQRGNDLLDSLEELRQQLLAGEVPLHTLQHLGNRLSAQKQMVSDPALLAIIGDIELRAAVELAKLEMANAARSTDPTA
jgi:hypothetical protein